MNELNAVSAPDRHAKRPILRVRIVGDIVTPFRVDVELPDGYDAEQDEIVRKQIAEAAGICNYGAEHAADFIICGEIPIDADGQEIDPTAEHQIAVVETQVIATPPSAPRDDAPSTPTRPAPDTVSLAEIHPPELDRPISEILADIGRLVGLTDLDAIAVHIGTLRAAYVNDRDAAEKGLTNAQYRQAAEHLLGNDECEFEEDAIVSRSTDGGAFIQAWLYLRNTEVKAALTARNNAGRQST